MPTPEPVPRNVVCSVCDQPWKAHRKPTLDECVRLLKEALARRGPETYTTTQADCGSWLVGQ